MRNALFYKFLTHQNTLFYMFRGIQNSFFYIFQYLQHYAGCRFFLTNYLNAKEDFENLLTVITEYPIYIKVFR